MRSVRSLLRPVARRQSRDRPGDAGRWGRVAFPWLGLGALVALYVLHAAQLVSGGALGLGWTPDGAAPATAGAAYVLVFLASGALTLALSGRTPDPAAWRLVGLGTASWGVGQLMYDAWQDDSLLTVADLGPADLFFLALPLCLLLAFRRFEAARPQLGTPAARLDLSALVVGAGVYLWYFVLAAQLSDPSQSLVTNAVNLLYPLSDLLMLTVVLWHALREPGTSPRSLWPLALGLLMFITADLGYSVMTVRDLYTGHQWPDLLWPLAAVTFAWAALEAGRGAVRQTPAPATSEASAPRPVARTRRPLLSRLAPYTALAGCFGLLLGQPTLDSAAARGVVLGCFVVALLVAVRQTHVLGQLERRTLELEESRAQLREQAFHDPLTGLGNRALLSLRLEEVLSRGVPAGLLFVDLDDFRFVNGALGHHVGDLCLREVARRLQLLLGDLGEGVRYAGDSFMLLVSPASPDTLAALGEQVRRRLAEPYEVQGERMFVTASVGGALCGGRPCQASTLLRFADTALFEAKRRGKNVVHLYSPERDTSAAARRMQIETRLRGALARGDLRLHYQPQQERAGTRQRFEALLRWHDELLGPVSPAEFIPIAEHAGLIVTLDNWVLDQACRQLAQWRGAHPQRRVAVNVTLPHLLRPEFLPSLRRTLERHSLPPGALELEITERLLSEQPDLARVTLAALLELGVDLAVDDFGVGQSSLSALLELPITTIKIDRAFIQPLQGTPDGQAGVKVVQAIIALGRALSLRVVAEGVESPEQARLLWDLGVDALQGYWVGRPAPADAPEPHGRRRG